MFTLEINGTALVVTNADEEQAKELFQSDDFKDDLKSLTRDGTPLWDGKAPLNVRAASEDEIDAFDEALNDEAYEDDEEEDEDEESLDVVFLVEIDDEDEDEDDASA
ncbi:MAG TPA: hypothetical protein VIL09_04255 [Microvirga sp.]|jgi:hypothetical protein